MNHSTYSVLARHDGSLLTQAKSARDGLIDLRSTIALDQFTGLARSHDPGAFVLAMVPVFGYDLTPEIYFALHMAAVAGELTNPPIEWSADCNYPAEYDDTNRCIVVHVDILNLIIQRPEETWQLLAILLAEFGNHLSNVLRNDIAALFVDATEEQETVGPNQTGWRYATYVAHLPVDHHDTVAIASYSNADGETHSYETPYAKAMENILRFQIYAGDSSTAVAPEGFEASASHHHQYTHESIETNLLSLLSAEEIRSITFGNWLRDYSQLLDPKLVRATGQFVNFPSVLSRQALTAIVDILAARKFSDVRANKQEAFTVTSEKLGVYRPSEHIDNPKVIDPTPSDPTAVDPDFEPWVQPGDALLQVDFETSMKRYIQRSIAFMQNELEAAIHLGRTDEGLRRLGAALHTLEDYFAHSNFVELSLIKEGHEVLPWTAPTDCKWGLPVVTGMFGSSDVIASLAGPVAEVLAPSIDWRFIPTRPGDRSDAEKMMTILLKESGRTSATAAYLSYLELRDRLVAIPGSEYVQLYSWATGAPGRLVSDALHSVFRDLITSFGNSIQHAQTLNGSDPNIDSSIDPSHSQLAKDHAEHPLHSLAGSLASIAIREVTKAMRLRWWNEPDAPDPIALATSFLTHPQDSEWQGVLVKRWAAQNPHNIHRATLKTELDQIGEALERAASRGFRKFTSNALATYEYLTEHFGIFFGTAGLLSSGKAQLPANTCCKKE